MANKSVTVGGKTASLPDGDSGWYLAIAVGVGILSANTRLAPWVFGVIGIATLYQTGQLLEGKYVK